MSVAAHLLWPANIPLEGDRWNRTPCTKDPRIINRSSFAVSRYYIRDLGRDHGVPEGAKPSNQGFPDGATAHHVASVNALARIRIASQVVHSLIRTAPCAFTGYMAVSGSASLRRCSLWVSPPALRAPSRQAKADNGVLQQQQVVGKQSSAFQPTTQSLQLRSMRLSRSYLFRAFPAKPGWRAAPAIISSRSLLHSGGCSSSMATRSPRCRR